MSAQQDNIYQIFDGKICVVGTAVIRTEDNPKGIIDINLWRKWTQKNPSGLVRKAGNGRSSLFALDFIPKPHRGVIVELYGNPEVLNPLESHYRVDGTAHDYYRNYGIAENTPLSPAQINQLTINASVLNAMDLLKTARTTMRTRSCGSRLIWSTLVADVTAFNDLLKTKKYGEVRHTLPTSEPRLKEKFLAYKRLGYEYLIDGRTGNTAAQVVTPQMLQLWMQIYAGQRGMKPNYTEVYNEYCAFLVGTVEIVNQETGEVYDRKAEEYRQVSESTVRSYQSMWENRAIGHAIRSGDRQKFKGNYIPFHKLKQPKFSGSMISIDDRQPPFEYAPGERMWFYNAIDLGSEAFTCWVYGDSKEGIITEFYRQLLRNYAEWGFSIPYELEAEMSLNASFMGTFLKPGAMFREVRIEANNARGKRIEGYYRQLRYGLEKKREGWLARPFALSEHNQEGPVAKKTYPKEVIVDGCLRDIETWNNTLHSDQERYPGMTRWDVQEQNQHPELPPTNWVGILPHLGYHEKIHMRAGRMRLQYKDRVVGHNGEVALGKTLIGIMSRIEGLEVDVYWLDDNDGHVLKAMAFDSEGRYVCEILSDLGYGRSKLERTEEDKENRTLMSAYEATVQGYINRGTKAVDPITILPVEQATTERGGFKIRGSEHYKPSNSSGKELPPLDDTDETTEKTPNTDRTSTASRF